MKFIKRNLLVAVFGLTLLSSTVSYAAGGSYLLNPNGPTNNVLIDTSYNLAKDLIGTGIRFAMLPVEVFLPKIIGLFL